MAGDWMIHRGNGVERDSVGMDGASGEQSGISIVLVQGVMDVMGVTGWLRLFGLERKG